MLKTRRVGYKIPCRLSVIVVDVGFYGVSSDDGFALSITLVLSTYLYYVTRECRFKFGKWQKVVRGWGRRGLI